MPDAEKQAAPAAPEDNVRAGALRRAASPLAAGLIALVAAGAVATASFRSTFAIFGRDQGIFQYVAWALGRGERAYLDFREINGPLVQAIHLVLMKLRGGDED